MGGKILPAFSQCRIWLWEVVVICRFWFPLGRNILWEVRVFKNKSLKFEFEGCYPPEESR